MLCNYETTERSSFQAWAEPFASGKKTAAEIIAGFVFSEEFEGRYLSTEEIVKALYRVMLNRMADEAGLAQWVTALDNGEPLESVRKGTMTVNPTGQFFDLFENCPVVVDIYPGCLLCG